MDGIGRYAGIDWAKDRHAVCVVGEAGGVVARFEVTHTDAGLGELVRRLEGVDGVASERPDGPVVDALLADGLAVVVIASRHVKALRTRHGPAGNKDDRSEAFVLADALRTDGHRLRQLRPDAPETTALRATVRARARGKTRPKCCAHPRPRLGPRDLAMLAGSRPVRPAATPRPPAGRRRTGRVTGGLT